MKLEINFPLFLLNFKCYKEIIGENSIKLAKYSKEISKKLNVCIAIAPMYTEIKEISKLNIPVFAQAADAINPGSYTGHIPLEAIKNAGAVGVIINHSEKQIKENEIAFLIKISKKLELISLVCGDTPEKCYKISYLNPDIIAIEPPELIGTGKSVSKYKPESIIKTINLVKKNKNIHVLCGAGISNAEDVYEALKLGTEGVLVSSSIIKSPNPYEKLYEMAKIMKKF